MPISYTNTLFTILRTSHELEDLITGEGMLLIEYIMNLWIKNCGIELKSKCLLKGTLISIKLVCCTQQLTHWTMRKFN